MPAAPPHLMATFHLEPEFCACSNATRRATSSSQQTREDACKSCDTYLGTERVKALIHTCPILEGTQTCIHVVFKKCAPPTGSNEQTQTPAWAILRLRLWSRQHGLRNPLPGHFCQLEGVRVLSARRSTTKALRPMWEASQVQITDHKVAPQRGRP